MPKFKELDKRQKQLIYGILKHKFDSKRQRTLDYLESEENTNLTYNQWIDKCLRLPSERTTTAEIDAIKNAQEVFGA